MSAAPIVITEDQVREALTFAQLIPAMERALVDFSAGRAQQPVRTVLPVAEHGGWFGVMPAVCGDLMGAKLVTFFPGNAARGLHTHLATIQLFRSSTGEPVAMMDGRLITEMRTAAVSAVATRLLAPPRAKVLALLGGGVAGALASAGTATGAGVRRSARMEQVFRARRAVRAGRTAGGPAHRWKKQFMMPTSWSP